jgi:Ca2+-binding RTX toxin-like protein
MRGKAFVLLATAALLAPLAALPAGSVTYCFGREPTIFASPGVPTNGTSGPDVILGTAGNDVIRGLGGNDRICGLGGNDNLEGGAGRDRLDGGAGADTLRGGAGTGNVLRGGPGDDSLIATGPSDKVRGGSGSDYIDAESTSFSTQRGGAGADTIFSGYRSDLNAGAGVDHCGLGLDVAGTQCETVELLCGSGGEPLPVFMVSGTEAPGDFDGNGITDTLYVWRSGVGWVAHIETDGGFGGEIILPTAGADSAEAVGGYDVNRDGVDEAFVKVGFGAHADIIGLYTLYEPIGSPALGFSCGMKAITFHGVPAEAEFGIGASLMQQSGLACRANGTLREYQQGTADTVHYTQQRFDYDYVPHFGIAPPHLGTPALSVAFLTLPADADAVYRASELTCGSLSL